MRRILPLTLAAVLMLVIGTTAIGSNMGFKISIPLYAYQAGAHSGFNWVSLPYYNQYPDAATAFADIPNCGQLQLFVEATNSYRIYDGSVFLDNFPIAPGGVLQNGTALLVKVSASGTWIVVGSHDPNETIQLYSYAAGTHSGFNWVSIPYHTTAQDAATLFAQIPQCGQLQLFVEATNSYRIYDGSVFLDNFPITPGQPVLVKVQSNQSWLPAHY